MVSCGVPECTNQADKNYNVITLATIIVIIIIIQLYHGIFKTLAYLINEANSKTCQISKVIRHVEKPGIIRTVYSDIFRNIQGLSPIFIHAQA